MSQSKNNVVPFPLNRRREMTGCPHCGTVSDVWQIGRLLWAYCRAHGLRWVVADFHSVAPRSIDRRDMTSGLEFLASYTEVTR